MDKLDSYRQSIKTLLSQYSSGKKQQDNWESQLIFDEQTDHYLWLDLGWEGSKRIYDCVMHLDLKQGKVWLQKNTQTSI